MTLPVWAKGSLLLAITLVTGVAIGVGYERRRVSDHDAPGSHHMLDRLTNRLELDSAQQATIGAILSRRQGSVDSTWHALQPHVRATMDSTLQEIGRVLRPEQVTKYRQMLEKQHPGAVR